MRLEYDDLRHDCDLPDTNHLPSYGERNQIIARFTCPTCGAKWRYKAQFLNHDRFGWEMTARPNRRWRKAEARRLRDQEQPL